MGDWLTQSVERDTLDFRIMTLRLTLAIEITKNKLIKGSDAWKIFESTRRFYKRITKNVKYVKEK